MIYYKIQSFFQKKTEAINFYEKSLTYGKFPSNEEIKNRITEYKMLLDEDEINRK